MFLKVHGEGMLFKIDFSRIYGRLKFLDWNIWTPDPPAVSRRRQVKTPPARQQVVCVMLVQLLYILGLVNLACGLFLRVSRPAQLAQPDLISHLPPQYSL
jgi:hypothetical protein